MGFDFLRRLLGRKRLTDCVKEKQQGMQQPAGTPLLEHIYHHADLSKHPDFDDIWSPGANMGSEVTGEHLIDYNGRIILAIDYVLYLPQSSQAYVIVPGFIVNQPKKYEPKERRFSESETNVSLIEPIADEGLREKIKAVLAEKQLEYLKGGVEFWQA